MKKITSVVLAILLVATMIPQGFAAEEYARDYNYLFTKEAFGSISNIARSALAEMTYDSLDSDATDSWKVAGSRYLYNAQANAYGLYWNAYANRADSGYGCFGVEIYVPEGGVYIPSLTYLARNSAPIVDVYLVKEGTVSGTLTTDSIQFAASGNDHSGTYNYILNLDNQYKLKNLDLWGDTTAYTNKVTENFNNVELTLDGNSKYYLLFRTVGKNEGFVASGTKELLEVYLESFKLAPKVEEPVDELTGLYLSAESATLMAGETTKLISTEVWSLSGNKIVTEGVTYKSSDDNIATVSSDGVVTAVAKGEVTITATLDGTDFSDDVSITVKELERATKEYTYNFSREAFGSSTNVQRTSLAEMTFDTVLSNVTSPWKAAATCYVYNTYADSAGLLWNAYESRADGGAAAYAIELKVPESGTYIPKLSYLAKESSPITNVYLVKNDGTLPEFVYGASGNGSGSLTTYIKSLGDKNKLASIDMYSEKSEVKTLTSNEVYLDSDYTYYLMFHPVGKNENFVPLTSGTRVFFDVKPTTFTIKPPAGEFDKAAISVHGLLDENDPMPNMTEKQIEYRFYDDVGIEIDNIDTSKLFIEYSSSDENVATVSETGLVTAKSNGQTKIIANITYKGVSRTAEYSLIVAPAGRNMMEHLNPDFEEDEWVWDYTRNDTAPETPVFFRAGIETEEKDGNADNRALAFTFNPDLPMPENMVTILLKRNGERVVVEPGKFYQLTLKVKTDIQKPEDGEYPTIRYNLYAYNNATGTSSSALAYVPGGNADINNFENWNETFSEWQEVVVPLYVDSEWQADKLYISPRLNIRAPSVGVGKTGYSGTIWMDDFELREVGYAGLEMEISGDTTVDGGGTFTVISKPYTTLGHYISVDKGTLADGFEIKSSDENIVSEFEDSTVYKMPLSINVASTVATCGGKNGTATISGKLTLEGITRESDVSVTTSGFEMKLLYAELTTALETIDAGEKTTAVPIGFMSDGSIADMSGGNVIFESLTPEIISVDENGNITGLRAGRGKFSATLFLGDNNAYAECEIIVSDISPIVSAELSCPPTVGYLRDEPIVLSGKMESGFDADFTNADIKWNIESDPVGGVSIDANNMIFGEIEGAKVKLSAEITLGGATVTTNEVEVTVVETDLRDFILNFGGAKEKKIENVTIDKYGWQVDWSLSHSTVKNTYLYNSFLYITTNSSNRDFAVDFTVPYTGNYSPIFVRGSTNGYGAEYVNIYIDGKYVGETSFCADHLRGMKSILNLRSLYLEKGTHKLTLRPYATKEVSRNYYMYPAYVRFAAIEGLPTICEVTTAKDSFVIESGATEEISAGIKAADGFVYSRQSESDGEAEKDIIFSYDSSDSDVAEVSESGMITAAGIGETTITVTAKANGDIKTKEISVKVVPQGAPTEEKDLFNVEIEAPFFVMNPDTEGVQLEVIGKADDGTDVDISNAQVAWVTENPEIAEVSDTGYATPKGLGSAKIGVTVLYEGTEKSAEVYISVREGKTGRTYYTDEMVDAARENITKYNWARSESKSVIASAEKYLGLEDMLWEMVPGEGIPRASTVGFRNDPDRYTCRYCGVNLLQDYGSYSWISKPLVDSWKIQCPSCKRKFPSNDFASFYQLGRDEHGIFNRELALKRHEEEFGGTYGTGYLKNTLYPEVGTDSCPVKLTGNETSEKWGVDDGFGYDTGRSYSNGCKEMHTYIAYYNHYGLWHTSGSNPGVIRNALETLSQAYMYTGDVKYGRVGAILLDRVADVYPGYDLRPYLLNYSNSDGGAKHGKILGAIWETGPAAAFSESYDALFPMYDDPYVVSFLAEKSKAYNNSEKNDKASPEKVRKNIEDGILREIYREIQRCSIEGNFGSHQSTLACAAIVLDTHPETDDMFKWLFNYSESDSTSYNTGGEINKRLINDVSRDGQGSESAPGYNRIWVTQMTEVADVLVKYDEGESVNLYEHPKFVAMIKSYAPLTVIRRGLAPIGDSGVVGKYSLLPDNDSVMINAFKETGDIEIAQHLYFIKGGDLDDLHYDIFTKNPESLKTDVEKIIKQYGEYDYDKNSLLSGYGFVAMKGGTLHKANASSGIRDTQHDFWMYFGGAQSHSHKDKLNLGIDAYGIPLTSDLGYPETAGKDPNRNQWQNVTLAHNTVVVNEKSQDTGAYNAIPLHFDQKDTRVKVMDVDASVVYATTDEYRRTVVMVDYDDEISYGIDFFKVLGGNDHLYSFHAFSKEDPAVSENINLKAQATGSYAGPAVMYGEDPWSVSGSNDVVLKYPVGYTWLNDIKRADAPGIGEFYVDWEIKDLWNQSRNDKQNIHLRMTMVNDWNADEITLANGKPPRTSSTYGTVEHLEYMLVRRKGRDLNTLFTTVIEPYDGSRYIKSIENVPVTVISGTPGKTDMAKAVKVELIDGRIDYIVYAQNNTVTYNVGDVFDFRGFVGVWTTDSNGKNIYSYINDGEMIGNDETKFENLDSEIEGKIVDFQKELSFDNWIDVEFDCEIEQSVANELSGRIIDVERENYGNSTYVIESVEMTDETHGRVKLGNVTLISSFVNAKKEELGYNYDVAVGKSFNIPMAYEENPAPVFDELSDNLSTSVGSSISVTVNATATESGRVMYSARTLPRGGALDAETGKFTWKPTASQIGDNLVAIDAVDECGRTNTQYFTITVYGSTSGGGAGGGGGTSTPAIPSTPEVETPDVPETTIRFTDLENHAWAESAINALADEGIIKGTSENTFSPANNITRADFAILLVRAFGLSSDDTENFADVSESDYFAKELAIARNTGIVNGIGDNRYAPRNTITRQDMMVIVYRAMKSMDKFVGANHKSPEMSDFDSVSDYAKEAVSALVGAGLVNGKNGKIAPTDYTTRAEVAVLIKRILDYIK